MRVVVKVCPLVILFILVAFQDVASLPSRSSFWSLVVGEITPNGFSLCSVPPELVFPPHFIKSVVEVKPSGPPHVLELWLE